MFKTYVVAGLVSSALLASAAFAQTATTTTTAPAVAAATSNSGQWRASKVVGLNVYNAASESLGSINDLLMDQQGNIKAAVIGVGGFLGVGEHLVAVTFDQLKFVNEPLKVASTMGTGTPAVPGESGAARPAQTTGAATTTTTTPATATPRNPWYPDHAVLDATKEQLKAMTEFKYNAN